jgi:hypothetical protein
MGKIVAIIRSIGILIFPWIGESTIHWSRDRSCLQVLFHLLKLVPRDLYLGKAFFQDVERGFTRHPFLLALTFNVYPEISRQNPAFVVKLTPQFIKTLIGKTGRKFYLGHFPLFHRMGMDIVFSGQRH